MGKEDLGRRLGVGILGSILALGVICMVIIGLNAKQGDNQVKDSPLVGFLAFEYDETGSDGSLYYEIFTGEKTLITDYTLGKTRYDYILNEEGDYFILDEKRKLVFYKDENGTLYMTEIGKEPRQIVESYDKPYMIENKSDRYLFCLTYDEDDLISYFIIDKDEKVVHEVETGLSELGHHYSRFAFDEEALTFCYADQENNLYCSTAYEAPKLIAEKVRYFREDKGIVLYAASDQEERSYSFFNGPMKGEQLKEEYRGGKVLVEDIKGESVVFFRGELDNDKALYMQRKGEESIVLARGVVTDFKYISETNTLYYLLEEGNLKCLDIRTVENSGVGKEKELATGMDRFSISPNGKLVISRSYHGGSGENLYLITEEGAVLLDSNTENSQVFDTYVIYQRENNQREKNPSYVKHIVNNEVVEEVELQYLVREHYLSEDYSSTYDGAHAQHYKVTPQGNYVTYFENKEGRTRLMLYTKEEGIQTLIENVDDYGMITINNQLYESPLKYGRVVGYYANEAFDVLLEMTKDQEMIIYSEGEEKGRVVFEVAAAELSQKNQIKFSPISGIDFTIDIFKNRFWNDEVFLSSNTIFENYDWGESRLILFDKTLILIGLDEVEFRNQLAGQRSIPKEGEEEFLTQSEAILFTKWYIGYRGEAMPSYVEVDHEEGDYYVVHTYDNTATFLKGYQVDKRSGEIIPLEAETAFTEREYKDVMTYKLEDDVLWMVDEQGNKGRLVKLATFYSQPDAEKKELGELLWQYGNSVYFAIRRCDTGSEYNEDTLWRYDLVQRKAVWLAETGSDSNPGVSYILEPERGTIRIEYSTRRSGLTSERIEPITGERQEWIAQYTYNGSGGSIGEEGELIYEVVRPKGEEGYFIREYNQTTKESRLLCEVDTEDYYGRKLSKAVIKVEDDIYFMDYTHYLTPKEVEQEKFKFGAAYCKVNVKTGEVSRVSQETYESLLSN